MKLIAVSKNKKRIPRESEVIGITFDGWVITKDGAFGDFRQDCEIQLDTASHLKEFRKRNNLSQLEMSWMLGCSRATYIQYEKGRQEINLKQFLILSSALPDTEWAKMRKKIIHKL